MSEAEIDLNTLKLTIDQLSELTGVPKQTLRYWEKNFPDYLRPSRSLTRRRQYGIENLEMVRVIKRLIEEEFLTREGVKRRLDDLFPKIAKRNNLEPRKSDEKPSTLKKYFQAEKDKTPHSKKM